MSATYTDEDRQAKAVQREAAERESRALVGDEVTFVWVASNRVDDQVIIFERDPAHPGGECFVGGPGVDYCARTGLVDRLIREGLLLETFEPPDGPKTPWIKPTGTSVHDRDVPGVPTRLGRAPDPDLIASGNKRKVEQAQERAPDEIAVPPQVEKAPEPTEPQSRQRR